MPRHPRLHLAHVPVHVIQRGNDRRACFHDDKDRRRYLEMLQAEISFFSVAVHAYVLMTNHVHILMTPDEASGIGQVMKFVDQRYAQYFNWRHKRVGTPWQGRYKSCLVDTDAYLLTCMRYIECNPVRAGMVRQAGDYVWSSYRANADDWPDPLIKPHPAMEALGAHGEWRRAYREFMAEDLAPESVEEIRKATNGGFALGQRDLLAQVAKVHSHPGIRQKGGRRRQTASG